MVVTRRFPPIFWTLFEMTSISAPQTEQRTRDINLKPPCYEKEIPEKLVDELLLTSVVLSCNVFISVNIVNFACE